MTGLVLPVVSQRLFGKSGEIMMVVMATLVVMVTVTMFISPQVWCSLLYRSVCSARAVR